MPASSPPKNQAPASPIKTYQALGLDIAERPGSDHASADCPFCGKPGKWYVNTQTGLWDCKVCLVKGNAYDFIRLLWKESDKQTTNYDDLAANRGLVFPDSLMHWGFAQSTINGMWLLPGYNAEGKMTQLYRYDKLYPNAPKLKLLATAELPQALNGVQLFHKDREDVYLCEGSWNAVAFWEMMRSSRWEDGPGSALLPTGAESSSLLANSNVLAVPGAGIFNEKWASLLAGKRLFLLYDNDHPRDVKGTRVQGAGYLGMRRVCQLLAKADQQPSEVHFLKWGDGEDGHNPDLSSGYDVRDLLSGGKDRRNGLRELLSKFHPIPQEWVPGRGAGAVSKGALHLETKTCESWKELLKVWKRAMSWTADLEHMLSVFLAAVISTETLGEQIWVLAMAPPSSGKTTFCESLATAREYVHCKSTLGKVYSGYKADKEATEDFGIIPHIVGKTFVVKDGDTILKDPNRGVILSQYRDLFDGVGRSQFNNGASRDYENTRFTFIICGTAAMREMDSNEVGGRFIYCSFAENIDPEHEREVNHRIVHRAFRNVRLKSNGKPETRDDVDKTEAIQMTGGYVKYLRENAVDILEKVEVDEDDAEEVMALGQFVAYFRARPPKHQNEVVERELSGRLVDQYARLTICLAAVLGKTVVDKEVMDRVRRVALDTARGKTLTLANHLYKDGIAGRESDALAILVGEPSDKIGHLLRFMKKIGILESFRHEIARGVKGHMRWRLTKEIREIYQKAVKPGTPSSI